jgi:DNA-binding transcriptional MerR regulator
METQNIKCLDHRIQQIEKYLENRFDKNNQSLQKLVQQFREQIGDLLEEIEELIGTTKMCKECTLCKLCQLRVIDANLKDCTLLRGNAND